LIISTTTKTNQIWKKKKGRVQLTITYTDPDNPPTGEGGDSAEGNII